MEKLNKTVGAASKTKERKLEGIRIQPADGGFTVSCEYGYAYGDMDGPPKPAVFTDGESMLAHVREKLKLKAK